MWLPEVAMALSRQSRRFWGCWIVSNAVAASILGLLAIWNPFIFFIPLAASGYCLLVGFLQAWALRSSGYPVKFWSWLGHTGFGLLFGSFVAIAFGIGLSTGILNPIAFGVATACLATVIGMAQHGAHLGRPDGSKG